MIRRYLILATGLMLLLLAAACSVNTDLGGTAIPNSRPDTRVTGQPPSLVEAGYVAEFRWTGVDPDGRVAGYQWKISDNGVDGISPRDTLTVDPLTGAELNPWHFTSSTDSTFVVLADQSDFPPDMPDSLLVQPRSFRSHSLFVRAVDDDGAVDPSPAVISFTSTTIVPVAKASYPGLRTNGARQVPATVNMGWEGTDTDFDLQTPVRARFLWKEAVTDLGFIRTPYEYSQYYAEVLSFDDPEWSDWMAYAPEEGDRRVSFPDREVGHYYLFAVQVQDTAGAVSVGLGYQQEVAHVKTFLGIFFPHVQLFEQFLGGDSSSEKVEEIAGGQPLNFSWTASAEAYNGKIVSYRHGWDLVDVDDPNDVGWAVPPGVTEQNLSAEEKSFVDGVHTFTLRVEDDSKQVRTLVWTLTVVPLVSREFQLPILVMDQVVDAGVQNWPDQQGVPRNSQDYRNPWWHFLADGVGGVAGIDWERDWKGHNEEVEFSDAVNYKVIMCYAQVSATQRTLAQFRGTGGTDPFVWFNPYQRGGGNLFLVGAASMESMFETRVDYMLPLIFDTREEFLTVQGQIFTAGFGTTVLPDESRVARGPRLYPYATAGITALDWTSPSTKYIYNRVNTAKVDRNVDCVGLKGLVLDEDFKEYHSLGPGALADTMWTSPTIDWHDRYDASVGTIGLFKSTFPFRTDEFVDGNIGSRPTVLIPQTCADGPEGRCIQPMYRGIARFDYLREYFWEQADPPEPDWPYSRYDDQDLAERCGTRALTSYVDGDQTLESGTALTTGQTFGYFSYKMWEDKPVRSADVYWGFDPYRFDSEQSQKAIRWVLQTFGLTINQ